MIEEATAATTRTMNILSRILPDDLPAPICRAMLAELAEATADAFECPAPVLARLSCDARLRAYALFTSAQAEWVLQSGCDVPAVKARLYGNAYRLGGRLRRWSGVDTIDEVMALGRLLYRAIGIEMQGDAEGNVTVSRCYFSRFYAAPVCDLISALDNGIFSGLSGGGRLAFSARLTEGGSYCRARLQMSGEGIG